MSIGYILRLLYFLIVDPNKVIIYVKLLNAGRHGVQS